MGGERRQLVVCVGPRCGRRGNLAALLDAGTALAEAHRAWSLGSYPCLGLCASGPNALVRRIAVDADPEEDPGYRDLHDGVALPHVTPAVIESLGGEP